MEAPEGKVPLVANKKRKLSKKKKNKLKQVKMVKLEVPPLVGELTEDVVVVYAKLRRVPELVRSLEAASPEVRLALREAFAGVGAKQAEEIVEFLLEKVTSGQELWSCVLQDFVESVDLTKFDKVKQSVLEHARSKQGPDTVLKSTSAVVRLMESAYGQASPELTELEIPRKIKKDFALKTSILFQWLAAIAESDGEMTPSSQQFSDVIFGEHLRPYPVRESKAEREKELNFWVCLLRYSGTLLSEVDDADKLQTLADCVVSSAFKEEPIFDQFLRSDLAWGIVKFRRPLVHALIVSLSQSLEDGLVKTGSEKGWMEKYTQCLSLGHEELWGIWGLITWKLLNHSGREFKHERKPVAHVGERSQMDRLRMTLELLADLPTTHFDRETKAALLGCSVVLLIRLLPLNSEDGDLTAAFRLAVRHLIGLGRDATLLGFLSKLVDWFEWLFQKCHAEIWKMQELKLCEEFVDLGLDGCWKWPDLASILMNIANGCRDVDWEEESLEWTRLASVNTQITSAIRTLNRLAESGTPATDGVMEKVREFLVAFDDFVAYSADFALVSGHLRSAELLRSILSALLTLNKVKKTVSVGHLVREKTLWKVVEWAMRKLILDSEGESPDAFRPISSLLLTAYSQSTDEEKQSIHVDGFLRQLLWMTESHSCLEETTVNWLVACPAEDFGGLLVDCQLDDDRPGVSLLLLRLLVQAAGSNRFFLDKEKLVKTKIQEMLPSLAKQLVSWTGDWARCLPTVLASLDLLSSVLSSESKLLRTLDMGDLVGFALNLASCLDFPSDLSPSDFTRVFVACHGLINECLKCPTQQSELCRIPSYVAVLRKMLQALLSRCKAGGDYGSCCHLLTRLVILMSAHKTDFNKVAPYMVSEFLEACQGLGAFPETKGKLLPGVYGLLDCCDQHAMALLSTNLLGANKEAFRMLYQDYQKYYRYSGFV